MGNKKSNMTLKEFCDIAMTMKDVQRRVNETQEEYFQRLNVRYLKNKRSRFVLQNIAYAIKEEPNDLEKAYEIYKKKSNNRQTKQEKKDTEDPEENPDKGQYGWVQELGLLRRQNALLQEQNKHLELISNKLAFIVEQLS